MGFQTFINACQYLKVNLEIVIPWYLPILTLGNAKICLVPLSSPNDVIVLLSRFLNRLENSNSYYFVYLWLYNIHDNDLIAILNAEYSTDKRTWPLNFKVPKHPFNGGLDKNE